MGSVDVSDSMPLHNQVDIAGDNLAGEDIVIQS